MNRRIAKKVYRQGRDNGGPQHALGPRPVGWRQWRGAVVKLNQFVRNLRRLGGRHGGVEICPRKEKSDK